MPKSFERTFAIRAVVCFILCVILAAFSVFRIFIINISVSENANNTPYNSVSFNYGDTRGDIYDCHGFLLTNHKTKYLAVISPTERAIKRLNSFFDLDERRTILESLKDGKPILTGANALINNDDIYGFISSDRYTDDSLAAHLIGYLNAENNGVFGIEKSYNDILYSNETFTVSLPTNPRGEVIDNESLQFYGKKNQSAVYLTIDKRIQKIAEEAAAPLTKGAIIIAETSSGKIRALVSKPSFKQNRVGEYLNDESAPLINRALSCYNVGSIFKPCVAIAALKEGLGDFEYTCMGHCVIDGYTFNCHKKTGHGKMNLHSALTYSCNTYFYNLAIKIDKELLYNTAATFGFLSNEEIAHNLFTKTGNISSKKELKASNRLVANFSIGQGDILLSPVSMLNLYNAIANGGSYTKPSVIEKTVVNGKKENYSTNTVQAMDKNISEILSRALLNVVEEGTGKNAKSEEIMLAGKTATAETGYKVNNEKAVHSWFCGFFPYYRPKYTVVVFAENSEVSNSSTAEIFKIIAEKTKKAGLTT